MPDAWNVTETEYRKAQELLRSGTDRTNAKDLWQLIRFYRGEIFYRDYAARGLQIVRAELQEYRELRAGKFKANAR